MAVNMIDNRQKKAIWTAAKEKGLSKEDLYSVILYISNKDHMTDLTYVEAAKVLDKINNRNSRNYSGPGKITNNQINMINDLVNKLGWNEQRLNGFVKTKYKVEVIKWLSMKQASNCIEALKNMIKRKNNELPNSEYSI